jgi:hypothetical protein
MEGPIQSLNQLVFLGETNFRNQRWRFGIKQDDRRRHMYVIGSTGMGKTEMLKNMAIQDIEAGRGIAFIDPHGDPVVDLLDYIPENRMEDVIYFDPGDLEFPIAFNVMEHVPFEFRHLVASGLLGVFRKIWPDVWSPRMEYILNNTILALLEYPDSTLLGINKMMSNKEYRKKVVANLKDPIVKSFWVDEFAKYADKFATEATAAIQNKIGQFISNNLIRNIIGQPHSTLDMRKIMDEGKILLVNISRGRIGEDSSRLLGALLVTKIQLAAMSRVDIPESQRRDFYLYVDEFQHFATESFANILSEARKFKLNLIMAHQYINQMEEHVRDAVFGNVGTIISFRVGAEDAEFLEKWFAPDFEMGDIVNLAKYNVYLKLMIDGVSSKGFSAATLAPFPKSERELRGKIIEVSRKRYSTARDEVEKNIGEWVGSTADQAVEAERKTDYQRRPQRDFGGGNRNYQSNQNYERSGEQEHKEPPKSFKFPAPAQVQSQQPHREESRPPRQPDVRPAQPHYDESKPPRQQENQPRQQFVSPQPSQSRTMSLDSLRGNPNNFRGKPIERRDAPRPKVEVNTDELKKILQEALGKKEE